MKTWSLTPILTSAYLSAMLTSGLAPIRPSVIFAAAIDPMAAQKALQNAVSAVAGGDWAAPMSAPALPLPVQVIASTQPPKADPVMTTELMARIIIYAKSEGGKGTIEAQVCAVFNLCDGKSAMPVKLLETEQPEGHYFMMPVDAAATDVIIVKKNADGTLDCFLTDKTFKLRAAAVTSKTGVRLITNEMAAKNFNAELMLMAKEASALPPPAPPSPPPAAELN